MPDMNGLHLVEILLGTGVLSHAILITGSFDFAEANALERRFGHTVPLVMKPFSADELLKTVQKLLAVPAS